MPERIEHRPRPRVSFFAPFSELKNISEIFGARKLTALFELLLKKTGEIFSVDVGFEVPPRRAPYDPELWECLPTLDKLRRAGHAEKWWWNENVRYADEPRMFVCQVQNTDRASNGDVIYGSGFDFFSKKKALWAAIGESVERRALSHFQPADAQCIGASYEELSKRGRTLDIFSIAGIHPQQRAPAQGTKRGFSFDAKTRFQWIRGRELTASQDIWIPLQLASFSGFERSAQMGEPILRPLVSTGAAAHRTLEEALVNGILELIERDAFMITWLNTLSPARIRKGSITNENLRTILQRFERYGLEVSLLHIPTDFAVNIVLAVVIDRSGIGPALIVGANADHDIEKAVDNAVREALGSRLFVRGKLEEARRRGTDISFPDRSVIHRLERLLYWCDGRKLADIEWLLNGELVDISSLPTVPSFANTSEKLAHLRDQFRAKKLELAYVDILDTETASSIGFRAVMTVVPKLQPLHLQEHVPFDWGGRLQSVPASLGLQPRAETYREVHPFP